MPDLRLISPPPRAELLAAVRTRLGHAVPGARVLAEGLLGAEAPIDFVALEPGGRLALVLVGEHDEDLELVGRALAQRAWVAARIGDWRQLAPSLGLAPDAAVRVVLLCPSFGAEARAALAALGPSAVAAVTYRCVQNGAACEVLLEHVPAGDGPARGGEEATSPPFRTALTDTDLGLSPAEEREFE